MAMIVPMLTERDVRSGRIAGIDIDAERRRSSGPAPRPTGLPGQDAQADRGKQARGGAGPRSGGDVAVGVRPLPQLLLELLALVHDELAVIAHGELESFQRSRGGTFEVDPRDVEPAPVTGALELLLAGQPVGRATQVGADRLEGVDDVLPVVPGRADDPEAPLGLEPIVDLLLIEVRGVADLDRAGRL